MLRSRPSRSVASDGQEALANVGSQATVVNKIGAPTSGYRAEPGTSFAAPHVSGIAALIWSYKPDATASAVRAALDSSALDLGSPGRDDLYGEGLVQAQAALQSLVAAPPPVTVSTTSLPPGQVAVAYSTTLAATPGVAPYSWVKQSGTLPPGVSVSAGGVISGTPTVAGTYNFVVQVTDSASPADTATKPLSITVAPGFGIVTSSLPSGTVGVGYSKVLAAAGGTPPYKWKKLTTFPKGLKLKAKTGVISGTPKVRGTFSVTVQVRYKTKLPKQKAVWHYATKSFTITIT